MPKVFITEQGASELSFLNFNITEVIDQIMKRIPTSDLDGISHLYVTDLPKTRKATLGAYFQKFSGKPAYIEIYLKNMFNHINNPDSMNLMLPIQSQVLARTIFHEVGHHVKHTKSHGMKKNKSESCAESYAMKLYKTYVLDTAEEINKCFVHLEEVANEKNLSLEIIADMKKGWEEEFRNINKRV
jgi:predicted Zn-dependent protease with MMP-like domain